jgi:hypothetical protein
MAVRVPVWIHSHTPELWSITRGIRVLGRK